LDVSNYYDNFYDFIFLAHLVRINKEAQRNLQLVIVRLGTKYLFS
jgi:hypothetical protein